MPALWCYPRHFVIVFIQLRASHPAVYLTSHTAPLFACAIASAGAVGPVGAKGDTGDNGSNGATGATGAGGGEARVDLHHYAKVVLHGFTHWILVPHGSMPFLQTLAWQCKLVGCVATLALG